MVHEHLVEKYNLSTELPRKLKLKVIEWEQKKEAEQV
jgi:hypothetical protein